MEENEYNARSRRHLLGSLAQMKQREEDLRDRLVARSGLVRDFCGGQRGRVPDPVRERLAFLLEKAGRNRRAVESALGTRMDLER